MKPSFTLAVVLCFAALMAVVMGAALSTLIDGALLSQTLGLDLLASETAAKQREVLERVFRRATTGMLTQRKLDEVVVTRDGARRSVQLFAQSGVWLTPSFYWATDRKSVG